jgi:transcriptional regulator with XRE-family HTH domain
MPARTAEGEAMGMETRMPCEHEYDFDLVLTGVADLGQEQEDALFEAGCDATISVQSGRVSLSFSRSAPSLREAILGAIRDVRKANIGARVLKVDDCNLVTQAEIARRIGRTRQLVHQYLTGARGPGGFPAPACEIAEGVSLWQWCEVADWLWRNGMLREETLRESRDVSAINSVLDFIYHQQMDPDIVNRLLDDLGVALPG